MSTYTFECSTCGLFEIVSSMKDYSPTVACPKCNVETSQRVYEADIPICTVRLADSEIRKIGHLAHRNTENMSQDQREELTKKHRDYIDGPSELPAGMSVHRGEKTKWV